MRSDMWGVLHFVLRRMDGLCHAGLHVTAAATPVNGRKRTGQTVQCLSKEEAAAGPQPTLTLSVYSMHS